MADMAESKPLPVTVLIDYQDALVYLEDVNDRIRDLNLLEETNKITAEQLNTRQALRKVRDMLMSGIKISQEE